MKKNEQVDAGVVITRLKKEVKELNAELNLLKGGKQKTINLPTLKKQGLALEEIEAMLTRTFNDMDHEIRDVDFVVDVEAVAGLVQPETDKLLGKI